MRNRVLGGSGLVCSEIALGTWGLSGESYGPVDGETADKTLHTALDLGISLIDTAAPYAKGEMERRIGRVLAERKAQDRVLVCTRLGISRPEEGPAQRFFDRPVMEKLVERSRERLGVPSIGIALAHNPSLAAIQRGEWFEGLVVSRKLGKVKAVGASVSDLPSLQAVLRFPVDVVEIPYNLFLTKLLHEMSGEIASHNVGVLARSPLAYGLLADTWGRERDFPDEDHRRQRWTRMDLERRVMQREAFRFLVRQPHNSLRAASLRYVLSNNLVSTCVVGVRTPEQLRQNVDAVEVLPFFKPGELSPLAERRAAVGLV